MTELNLVNSTINPLTAILWCFYPMAVLVMVELLLRANDDDDDEGGKGIRVQQPYAVPSGA